MTLEITRLIREFFLQQNAFHPIDTFCPMDKQYKLLDAIQKFSDKANAALESGVLIQDIITLKSKDELAKVRFEEDFDGSLKKVMDKMDKEFDSIKGESFADSATQEVE